VRGGSSPPLRVGAALALPMALAHLACRPDATEVRPAPATAAPDGRVVAPAPQPDASTARATASPQREPICAAGAAHCFEGNLHRCDATGASRTLVQDCRGEGGVCLAEGGPACRTSCDPTMMNVVLAVHDCFCGWEALPFCAEVAKDIGCAKVLCQHGEIGSGFGPYECSRDTDGWVVPSSERAGPCGADGQREVLFEVCANGAPAPGARREACPR
jgi:hypothetical protein